MKSVEIQRTFDDVHFRLSTVRTAFSTLAGFIPEGYPTFESFDGSVRTGDETRKFSDVSDFLTFVSDEMVLKEFWYRRSSHYALSVSPGSSFSSVSISAASTAEIDAVLAVLNAASENSRIPKPVDTPARFDRTITAVTTDTLSRCCVLDQQILERIDAEISRWSSRISFQIDCRDRVQRTFARLADVLGFENPPGKDIAKLRIAGRAENFSETIAVWFDRKESRNVVMYLEGSDEMIQHFRTVFLEQMDAAKPWYSAIAKAEFRIFIVPLIFLLYWIVLLGRTIPKLQHPLSMADLTNLSLPQLLILFGAVALGVLLPQIIGGLLDLLKRFAFPKTVFAIGQGSKRHAKREILRTVIILGFIVSLASSFLVLAFSH